MDPTASCLQSDLLRGGPSQQDNCLHNVSDCSSPISAGPQEHGNVFGMSCWFGCFGLWIYIVFPRFPTVDGRNLANHLGSIRFLVKSWDKLPITPLVNARFLKHQQYQPEKAKQDVGSSVRKPVRRWLNITRLRCWWYLHHYMWQCLRRHRKFCAGPNRRSWTKRWLILPTF